MGDPITVADVDPEIDKALADLEPILSSARNAAEPYVPVPGGAAQFPGYGQWLDLIVPSIKSGTDPSDDSGFIQASSAARTELAPSFLPQRILIYNRRNSTPNIFSSSAISSSVFSVTRRPTFGMLQLTI